MWGEFRLRPVACNELCSAGAVRIRSEIAHPKGKAGHHLCVAQISAFHLTLSGAGEEIRTLDPNLGKVVLYH